MHVRLYFPAPGFFLNDPRLVIQLDGRTVYDGSFKSGFDVSVEVQPGPHVVETAIHAPIGGLARTQKIELALDADGGYRGIPAVDARLEYSRMTGNFKKRASVSTKR